MVRMAVRDTPAAGPLESPVPLVYPPWRRDLAHSGASLLALSTLKRLDQRLAHPHIAQNDKFPSRNQDSLLGPKRPSPHQVRGFVILFSLGWAPDSRQGLRHGTEKYAFSPPIPNEDTLTGTYENCRYFATRDALETEERVLAPQM